MIRDGKLSAGHGRALAALPAPSALCLARDAVAGGWSVRDIERRAAATSARARRDGVPETARPELPPDLAEVETRLRFALATKVTLTHGAHGGSIEIGYADDDELQRIVDRICPSEP